ncbi:MAG: hypothetical protein IIB38_14260, partial [Candidatus Hydrogenedentes bacterium]|nr:hypothetical protein [Candidatus Hydrogenedentota bacterium]
MSSDTQAAPTVVRNARIICGAILGFTVVYAVVGFALIQFDVVPSGGFMGISDDAKISLRGATIVAGMLGAIMSFQVKRVLTRRIDPGQLQSPAR